MGIEKITFHTSTCFGNCAEYHLKVDMDKNISLHAAKVFKTDSYYILDSNRTGYFTGIASDTTFNKLYREIERIGLDTLEFDGGTCCDGSVKTIVIYYKGKRKFLQSMTPPEKARELISILYDLCEPGNLQRAKNKFEIEDTRVNK